MAEIFAMPKLGMDMEEGLVAQWMKAEGDVVKKGEILAEIETDKSCVEVEAPCDGTVLKILLPEGEAAACGSAIAVIGAPGEPIPDLNAPVAEASSAPAEAPTATVAADDNLFFCMPKQGMDMEEGVVARWLKAEGDSVKKGEFIVEIETDKASMEIESPLEGTVLKLYWQEGDIVPCGTPIAAIGAPGTAVPETVSADTVVAQSAEQKQEAPVTAPQPVQVAAPAVTAAAMTPGGRVRISPRAARLANKNGVDLSQVTGSGEEGRIIESDVIAYLQNKPAAASCRVATETVQPLTGVRKVTARRMMQSLNNSAQTNHRVDVDTTNLLNFRKQANAMLEKDGLKVSIADILTMACARALIEHPMANASLLDDGLHMHNYANIGIACDTPKGLVVPVIKDADILSLTQMAAASKAAINKARNGELKPDDMSGGTFTISNLGMFEIDSFTAVLNPPETCILAVGRIADRVVAENGQMVIRPMMNLCLTYDHQVLDGAPAARFLETIKHYIENPVWLML